MVGTTFKENSGRNVQEATGYQAIENPDSFGREQPLIDKEITRNHAQRRG